MGRITLSGKKAPLHPDVLHEIPLEYAEKAYEEYAERYPHAQTFERLNARGGFSTYELIVMLYSRIKRLEGGKPECP
jgi:hypothetical protein